MSEFEYNASFIHLVLCHFNLGLLVCQNKLTRLSICSQCALLLNFFFELRLTSGKLFNRRSVSLTTFFIMKLKISNFNHSRIQYYLFLFLRNEQFLFLIFLNSVFKKTSKNDKENRPARTVHELGSDYSCTALPRAYITFCSSKVNLLLGKIIYTSFVCV